MCSQRTKVGIQSRQQLLEDSLQWCPLLFREKSALVGAPKKVPYLIKRSTRYSDKSLVIYWRGTAVAFCYVRSDAVGRSHELMANGAFRKCFPSSDGVPHQISQLLGQRVHPEFFQCELCHA